MNFKKLKKLIGFGTKALPHAQVTFSQFGEDLFLRTYFQDKKDGFFVDIGAFHPYRFSNTHYLRSLGWKGINIEPQPRNWAIFEKHCPNDINVNCAVSSKAGTMDLLVDGTVSRLLDSGEKVEGEQVRVLVETLESILDEKLPNKTRIDLLSIDCEGHDMEVLHSNCWKKYRPGLIMVEDLERKIGTEFDSELSRLGYELISWYKNTKFFELTTDFTSNERK